MNSVNKTLYIPLFGKAYVSRKGLFFSDPKAEEIWDANGFPLKGKSRSKWLAYYLGIRAAVYDEWVRQLLADMPDAVVLHIGCGLDSRVLRVNAGACKWYDVDFPEVIAERVRYYSENGRYHMLAGDVRDCRWLEAIPETGSAIVVMEGVSMYLTSDELRSFAENLSSRFTRIAWLADCYTVKAAKLSKIKNPVNDVGVTEVYGIDDPTLLQTGGFTFIKEHEMTPQRYIDELHGAEKIIFQKLYAGSVAKKLYRMFEYRKQG